MHVHTMPLPAGWTEAELERWLDQGLVPPDGPDDGWVVFECPGVVADCDWARDAAGRGESFVYMDYRDHTLEPPGVIDL